jgi:hypothetical protein
MRTKPSHLKERILNSFADFAAPQHASGFNRALGRAQLTFNGADDPAALPKSKPIIGGKRRKVESFCRHTRDAAILEGMDRFTSGVRGLDMARDRSETRDGAGTI